MNSDHVVSNNQFFSLNLGPNIGHLEDPGNTYHLNDNSYMNYQGSQPACEVKGGVSFCRSIELSSLIVLKQIL